MKKILFISYSNEDLYKVKLITKALTNHSLFEPLVVANKREPNKTLVSKVTEGIEASYCVIPILTIGSINTQWINQEIGYATGRGINVIPIIENKILDSLKGFIHKQNDLPYSYKTRSGISMRDENKSFMACFRLLIKDLEAEHNKKNGEEVKKSSTNAESATGKKIAVQLESTFPSNKKFDYITVRSEDKCPMSGLWRSDTIPSISRSISKGQIMPPLKERIVSWKLFPKT